MSTQKSWRCRRIRPSRYYICRPLWGLSEEIQNCTPESLIISGPSHSTIVRTFRMWNVSGPYDWVVFCCFVFLFFLLSIKCQRKPTQEFPGSPVVRAPCGLSLLRVLFQSRVRELRSYRSHGVAKKERKEEKETETIIGCVHVFSCVHPRKLHPENWPKAFHLKLH